MKKRRILAAWGLTMAFLSGCGASFDVSQSTLEDYANDNEGVYADVTSDYSDYDYVEGVYVVETDDIHVELWDLDSTTDASAWFQNNVETLKSTAKTNSGSSTSNGGNYKFNTDDGYYRILFSEDEGVYAHGDKEAVDAALSTMGIAK